MLDEIQVKFLAIERIGDACDVIPAVDFAAEGNGTAIDHEQIRGIQDDLGFAVGIIGPYRGLRQLLFIPDAVFVIVAPDFNGGLG
ncbi:hypothetical protein SDC9_202478 [bioreactor metagenome]|uniref:Uncharacterized protein n=1 Tax=bioreactor metagenome TaxID=1076179 RepID=A0A645ITS4_9ZZZZ